MVKDLLLVPSEYPVRYEVIYNGRIWADYTTRLNEKLLKEQAGRLFPVGATFRKAQQPA